MCAAITTIKSRFKKDELITILNKFNLPITGTKHIMAERIFELKQTCEELCEIVEIETFGYLRSKIKNGLELTCCVCLRKGFELDMYSCKTCKEGIVCPHCIDNIEYNICDKNYNELCPICKNSKLFSNYEKNKLRLKCNLIKEISQINSISITTVCDIIRNAKFENSYDETEPFKASLKFSKFLCDKLNITIEQSLILKN